MFDRVHARPSEKFETLLETLDERAPSAGGKAAMTGAERFWLRASGRPPSRNYVQRGQLERFYEIEPLVEEAAPPPDKPQSPEPAVETKLPARLIELIGRAGGGLNLAELRSLRRQCALALHPDRVASAERERAQQLMAEANAAIDRAMKKVLRGKF